MSALLNKEKQARARAGRKQRREDLVQAGAHLFVRQPWAAVTLDYVGRRIGVANGIASLHFPTKEELFLEVIKRELAAWFDATGEWLAGQAEPVGGAELASRLATDLADRPELTRMLALLHNVLEQNVDVMSAQLFWDWLRKRALDLAASIEKSCSGFAAGDGAVFLRRLAVVAVGLRQTAAPSGIFSALLQDENFSPFRAQMTEELDLLVRKILPDTATG